VKKWGSYEKSKIYIQQKISTTSDYRAFFISVLAYINEKGEEFLFKGRLDGKFIFPPRGNDGFAYDDVFQPNGYDQTLAELGSQWKKNYSHRALSIQQFMNTIKP
jgi:XTP/dITP diphosphohydrolase